jgi:serine/threonine protein phosphatase 1
VSKIVAVGDIHADAKKLHDVLNKLSEKVSFKDTPFVFLGDYIDGARNAKEVIFELRMLEAMYPDFVFLKGNHEDMMLDALRHKSRQYRSINQWWTQGGFETYLSYEPINPHGYDRYFMGNVQDVAEAIGREHLDWLENLPTMYESKSYLFVHAGFLPNKRPKMTSDLQRMWLRDEFIDSEYDWGKVVVAGHTHQGALPTILPNKMLIDTMHHGHGSLTAVILDEETKEYEVVQSFST